MNKISKTTTIIFIVSFFVIYVKFMKIEDQLFGGMIQTLSADASSNITKKEKNVEDNKKTKKDNESNNSSEKISDKISEKQTFETLSLDGVSLDTARKVIDLQLFNDNKFFDKAVQDISSQKIDEKIQKLKLLVDELKNIQKSINDELTKKNQLENENLDNLIRVIESMNPKQAATMFAGLTIDTRVLLVKKMDQSKLSSIISFIDPKISTETFEKAFQKE